MEYAEDIWLTVNSPSSALYYITYLEEDISLKAFELCKEFAESQTDAWLLENVIYFDGYLEFAASKFHYSQIER